MTRNEMHDLLEIYIEDAGDTAYTDAQKDTLLNVASDMLIWRMPAGALPEVQGFSTSNALTNIGAYKDNSADLSGAEWWAGPRSLVAVRHSDRTKKWGRRISFQEFVTKSQRGDAFNEERPDYYLMGTHITVKPDTVDNVDLVYLTKPTRIASGVDSPLSEMYHEWIVSAAAYLVFRADDKLDRAISYLNPVLDRIEELKADVQATDSVFTDRADFFDDESSIENFQVRLNVTP